MKLRIQPKTRFSAHVEIDGICRGTLPLRVLLQYYPAEFAGEVGSAEVEDLLKLLRDQAFNLLVDYLAKAEHSEWQCRNFLKRKNFEDSIIEGCLARCRKLNYLNDKRFSELLVSSYLERRASKRAIIAKLREQRISETIWGPVLERLYDPKQASGGLSELLQKYCLSHRGLPRNKLKEKAFSHLFRKGFELEDIRAAWESLDGE